MIPIPQPLNERPAMMAVHPTQLDEWFSRDRQRVYIDKLLAYQHHITRRQATCFIRLWAYLLLKEQQIGQQVKLLNLELVRSAVACTHREAADVFYGDQERGSDRAAGMMIDQLVKISLVRKSFDGNTNQLAIRAFPELIQQVEQEAIAELYADQFNPRTDTIPVASFLAHNYSWIINNPTNMAHKMARVLRQWSQQYPQGMRVLRRRDNQQPVGLYVFFPTANRSEQNFFLPPTHSLHLSTVSEIDPIEIAIPGDLDCISVFIRSWIIDRDYTTPETLCKFLGDAKTTFITMRQDFPNLCDIYALSINPNYEALTQVLGFQKTIQDPVTCLSWLYLAIDRFLDTDLEMAIAQL